jgi:HlyD family secretion protein/adhesin transport system membrane fusion protein
MENRSREKQLRYLAQSIRLREAASPRLVRMTMLVASLSIIVFLGWAAVTDVHEIAHTPGDIVPSGYQQVVQHLEGGIVKTIDVREGQRVEKGQVVMTLDGTGVVEDLQRARDKALSLAMQEERLRAFLGNRTPHFSPEAAARPDLLRDQEAFFTSMADANKKQIDIVNAQIAQKKQSIAMLRADLDTARRNAVIAKDLFSRRQELNRQGLVPDVKLLESEQSYNQLTGQIRSLESQIAVAESAILEYRNRLSSLKADSTETANQKLGAVIALRAENRETIKKLTVRVARLDVRAPVRGIVKGLSVNTIGSVVQPGQVLMEIVPADAPLVVDLKIPTRYIGHMKTGQRVQVKFSSYDFSRYGAVPGRLDFISAAAFTGRNGERYYQGRVSLKRGYVGANPHDVIMPGMTVMADVITGDKTILEYLLKPIRNALSTAFTER